MNAVSLIARKILFSDPDRADVQLSYNGKYISFLAPHKGTLNIWVAERDKLDEARPITEDQKRGIRNYAWAWDHEHLLYAQDQDGNEDWVIYALNIHTLHVKALTPSKGVHAMISRLSEDHPYECLISMNDRRPDYHDLYRVNILTGEKTLVLQNDQFTGFITDGDLQLRFASQVLPDGSIIFQQKTADAWKEFMHIEADDVSNTTLYGFDKSGQKIYMLDSREENTSGLYIYDLNTNEQHFIHRDSQADISAIMFHPLDKTIQAVATTYDRKRWTFFDTNVQEDIQYLRSLKNADIEIVSRTQDDQLWIVVFLSDNGPLQYYLFDRINRQASYLFCNRTALENIPLTRMHAVEIPTRDGLKLVSYLTIPLSEDPEQTGRPSSPIPLILLVHGGPQARDHWGFHPTHQWLANRGYAVLSVNYRGSTGFGKNFIKAGNGEWAAKMHDDLLDAIQWSIKENIADSEKVCIYGGSYGGYAALVGLTFTPDVFACAVDLVGPSNLETLVDSIPPYWKPIIDRLKLMIGADPDTPEGRDFLKARSPITYVDRIIKPLLIGQGANDPRVKQAESDQIVRLLKQKGIPVTYALYPDEGHGFQRPENRQSFNAITEIFLQQALGGRSEPIGDDFNGASIEIRAGIELISGLNDKVSA